MVEGSKSDLSDPFAVDDLPHFVPVTRKINNKKDPLQRLFQLLGPKDQTKLMEQVNSIVCRRVSFTGAEKNVLLQDQHIKKSSMPREQYVGHKRAHFSAAFSESELDIDTRRNSFLENIEDPDDYFNTLDKFELAKEEKKRWKGETSAERILHMTERKDRNIHIDLVHARRRASFKQRYSKLGNSEGDHIISSQNVTSLTHNNLSPVSTDRGAVQASELEANAEKGFEKLLKQFKNLSPLPSGKISPTFDGIRKIGSKYLLGIGDVTSYMSRRSTFSPQGGSLTKINLSDNFNASDKRKDLESADKDTTCASKPHEQFEILHKDGDDVWKDLLFHEPIADPVFEEGGVANGNVGSLMQPDQYLHLTGMKNVEAKSPCEASVNGMNEKDSRFVERVVDSMSGKARIVGNSKDSFTQLDKDANFTDMEFATASPCKKFSDGINRRENSEMPNEVSSTLVNHDIEGSTIEANEHTDQSSNFRASILADKESPILVDKEIVQESARSGCQDRPVQNVPPRRRRHRKLVNAKFSLEGAGCKWEEGCRRSTRIRSSPLRWWKGERFLYGRIHKSLTTIIGVKKDISTNPSDRCYKIHSYVSEEYQDLVNLAASG